MVDLFANQEEFPHTMFDVLKRKKDLEFANHYREVLYYFCKEYHYRKRF